MSINVGSIDNCSIITSTAEEMEPGDESLYKYKGLYFITDLSSPENLDSLDSFEIRDDDIFVITYPKSGKFKVVFQERVTLVSSAVIQFFRILVVVTLLCYNQILKFSIL